MDDTRNSKMLQPPKPRRSVEMTNQIKEKHLNATLEQTPRPTATSTIQQRGCESLIDPYHTQNEEILNRDAARSFTGASLESSLGLLDIKGLECDFSQMQNKTRDMKSLSFNPREISGRSTNLPPLNEDSKENSISLFSKMSLGNARKSTSTLEDILRDAKNQSQAVHDFLKTTDNPTVNSIRMSLESYKHSIANNRDVGRPSSSKDDLWGYKPLDFGANNGNSSGMRDSMFMPANKMDLSKEELSWMKEHGALPCYQQSITIDTDSDKTSSKKFLSPLNETANDFQTLRSDATTIANASKVSVGNYFKRRSENINQMLPELSPEKTEPHPPLFVPGDEIRPPRTQAQAKPKAPATAGETFRKSHAATKELPFLTLSDDSELSDYRLNEQESHMDLAVLSHVNNMYTPLAKEFNVCRDLTNTLTIDDSLNSTPFSLTQIRKFMGKLDTERPSILLDNMLAMNKKNKAKSDYHKSMFGKTKISAQSTIDIPPYRPSKITSPTLRDNCSFGRASNIFHSTRHGEENILQTPVNKNGRGHSNISPVSTIKRSPRTSKVPQLYRDNKSPTSKKSSNAGSSRTLSSFTASNNTDDNNSGSVSTLKNHGKSNSGSSGLTESSIKSMNTVVHVKPHSNLVPINENRSEKKNRSGNYSKSKDNSLQEINPRDNRSPSIGTYSVNALTPSDSSKEIYNCMSPASNNEASNNSITPKSSSHPKRLFDQYKYLNSKDDGHGWISPAQTTRGNDISKECIAGQTPLKAKQSNISHGFSSSTNIEYGQANQSAAAADHTLNVPSPGDWIVAESKEEDVYVGVSHDLNIKLSSISSRWISVEFGVNSVYVDGQFYQGDISDVIMLQAPVAKILLKADSQNICTLKATVLIPNKDFNINLDINLVDVVTKSESSVQHEVKIHSTLPELIVKLANAKDDFSPGKGNNLGLEFPAVPEKCDTCLPMIFCNDSPIDLSISLDIRCECKNMFAIGSITIISRSDINLVLTSPVRLMHLKNYGEKQIEEKTLKNFSISNRELFTIPSDKSTCFKVLIYFRAPHLEDENRESLQIEQFEAALDISLASNSQSNPFIHIDTYPLLASVGVWNLLLRNKDKSNILMVKQGCSEDFEMFNAGNIPMQLKLFMSEYYEGDESPCNMVPCDNPMFTIDKPTLTIEPGGNTKVRIGYPSGDLANLSLRRSLVFDNPFSTEVMHVVGVPGSRSGSQQSTYSVDSAVSHSQEFSVKSSKKELSWGSLKVGDANVQDVTFKNQSVNRKLRVIATITGEGFKFSGENGVESSFMFSLQPQECRTVRVQFRPTQPRGHAGVLRITHRTRERDGNRLLHKVLLHGMGGRSALVFRDGVFKHGGAQGLPLGSLNETGEFKDIHFSIWNKGGTPAFVLINLDLKWKYRNLAGQVEVIPQRGIVGAGALQRCVVRVPRRALLLARGRPGDTETLAVLTFLHGDEFTRLRIKRICSENFKDKKTKDAWNEESQGKLNSLCAHFPSEDSTIGNINNFKESVDTLKKLLDELQQKEVMVTYDVDLDITAARLSSELDETLQFHSMCADNTAATIASDYR